MHWLQLLLHERAMRHVERCHTRGTAEPLGEWMPRVGVRGRQELVSSDSKGQELARALGSGRGLLRHYELVEARTDSGPSLRPEVLVEFLRSLVRNTWSGDTLCLSLHAAQRASGATDEEMGMLRAAIAQERSSFQDDFAGEVER